jgi:putative ATP-grasp target RiPP
MVMYRDDPLASVVAQFPMTSAPFAVPEDGGNPSGPASRPWGLRWLRPAPALIPPAYRYCPVRQVAVSTDGSGRLWMDNDGQDWSSIAERNGDEGPSEDYGWDTTGDVS